MSHTPDDKSVQEEYYTLSGEHGHAESYDHINPLVQAEEQIYPAFEASIHNKQEHISRTTQIPPRIPPRRIALCGGGVRGVAHVGVRRALRDAGILACVKEIIGISAGSLFALLWVLDYTIEQTEKLSLEFDFTRLINIEPETALLFPITYGLDDGKGIEGLITSILKHKGFGPDATFEDLAKHHHLQLRCFATELQTSKIREFSTSKTPRISVKHALRASMSLPLFYTPVEEENGSLLVDGGILHNLPLVFLNEQERNETWGVLFTVENQSVAKPVTDVMQYIRYIHDSVTLIKNIVYIEKFHNRLICIPADVFGALDFQETRESRQKLINLAYQKTREFLFTRSKLARRYSAS